MVLFEHHHLHGCTYYGSSKNEQLVYRCRTVKIYICYSLPRQAPTTTQVPPFGVPYLSTSPNLLYTPFSLSCDDDDVIAYFGNSVCCCFLPRQVGRVGGKARRNPLKSLPSDATKTHVASFQEKSIFFLLQDGATTGCIVLLSVAAPAAPRTT